MPQRRNDEHVVLQLSDLAGRSNIDLAESLGDFGVYNGQFELGDPYDADNPDPYYPDGWEGRHEHANSTLVRDTGGLAGSYCMKGGNPGAQNGATLWTHRYFPVDEDRDYYVSAAFKAATANNRVSLRLACYNANKTYLGTVSPISVRPGVAWVRYQRRVGPNGDVGWWGAGGTRYARVVIYLNDDATYAGNCWVDDVQFQQMKAAHDATLSLMPQIVGDNTNWAHPGPAATWVADPNSPVALTLSEPGYIHVQTDNYLTLTAAAQRSPMIQGRVFVNAVATTAIGGTMSSSIAWARYDHMNFSGIHGPVAAGNYTVQNYWYLYNAADAMNVYRRHMSAFWTRQY